MIIKRRPLTEIYDEGTLSELAQYILEAEDLFKAGKDKKRFVIESYYKKHPSLNGKADVALSNLIEYLLVLPTKKGGKGREETKSQEQ